MNLLNRIEKKDKKVNVYLSKVIKRPEDDIPKIELQFKSIDDFELPNYFKLTYEFGAGTAEESAKNLNNLYYMVIGKTMDIDEIHNIHKIHAMLNKLLKSPIVLVQSYNKGDTTYLFDKYVE